MKALKHTIVRFTLLGYIFLAVFGLFAMSAMHHHSMSSMGDCPFMVGKQSICTMTFTDHISAWQSLSTAPKVRVLIMLLPVLFVFFVLYLHPPNRARICSYTKRYLESAMTALFSQGILHPKAP